MAWQTIDQQYDEGKDKNERSNYLKDILLGLQIANNNDPWTLAGFGLGRWLANYLDRGWKRREEEIMKEPSRENKTRTVEGHRGQTQSTAGNSYAREQAANVADQFARETNPGEWVNRQYANPDSFTYDPWKAYQSGAVSLEDSLQMPLQRGLMPNLGWRK